MVLTAEHDTTKPIISIPACASATLAAIAPDAMQLSIPSASIIVMKTSMVDLGNSSSRTAGTKACWICNATDLSSASYAYMSAWVGIMKLPELTHAHRCSSFSTRERCKFYFHIQPPFLTKRGTFRLSRSITVSQLRKGIAYTSTKDVHCTCHLDLLGFYVCRAIRLVDEARAQNYAVLCSANDQDS